jgi:2-polyprenyl-6-methoxyphenol hydroxylase-like FAD-dependent oxidoreductase
MGTRSGHAVVIGGSMAGLVTARVLADRFEVVTIVERDDLPSGPDARKGVPQGRHAHGLLAAGEQVLGELFPGIVDELVDGGSVRLDFAPGARWFKAGAYRTTTTNQQLYATLFSRPFLEDVVRRRVLALDNVTLHPGSVAVTAGSSRCAASTAITAQPTTTAFSRSRNRCRRTTSPT